MAGLDFESAYREHFAYVWRTLQRLGVRFRDMEDLAHDVFCVAYRRRASFDASLPVRPWLFGIAFRVASDHRRRARHDAEVVTDSIDVSDGAPRQDDAAASRQLCLAALSGLSIEQRAVLVMHDLDGYTAGEIASSLELSPNTVYSRLRLARGKFTLAARRLIQGAA